MNLLKKLPSKENSKTTGGRWGVFFTQQWERKNRGKRPGRALMIITKITHNKLVKKICWLKRIVLHHIDAFCTINHVLVVPIAGVITRQGTVRIRKFIV